MDSEIRNEGFEATQRMVEHLAIHEHLALLFSNQREQFDVIAPFLKTGLERGERCLYLVDDITSTSIVSRLNAEGLEATSALEAKSLIVEVRRRGYFDPEFTIRLLKEAADAAIAEGFTALRIASEMSWLLARDGGIERLNEFEAMLNYFFPQYPALGICQYNLQRFRPDTVKEVVLCHPNVIVGRALRRNPMEDSNVRLNLVITEHQRTEERLRQSEMRLAEAQRLAHIGSYDYDVHSANSEWSDETFRILGLDPSITKPSFEELIRTVHPEDRVRVERTIIAAFREHYPFQIEFRINVGRSVKHIMGLGQMTLNDTGQPARMFGTLMDMTEYRRMLDALQASEERYKTLLASVTDYVYSVSISEGRAVSTSHGAGCLAVTGYSPEDHVRDPYLWYNMVHPDDRRLVTEEAERRMRGESTKALEHRILHKNGSVRWMRNTIVPRHDQHGKLIGYDGLVEDITERKSMESGVRGAESHSRAMLDSLRAMLIVCAADFRVEFMNARAIRHVGRDARGEDYRKLQTELAGVCPKYFSERAFAGHDVHWEERCPSSGSWYSIVNTPIKMPDGTTGVLAAIEDITGTKRLEEVLQENRQRYLDLLDSIYDWIWEVDEKGYYTFASKGVRSLLGYSPEEVVGKQFIDLLMPFEVERISSIFQDYVSARKPIVSLENICKHKEGRAVVVETSAKPFFDKEGKLIGYRGVDRDITERRKKEREPKKAL